MDIRKMHIYFDLLRQQVLGNDYTHLEHEMKDDFLNMSIDDMIRLKTANPTIQEEQSNVITEQYYEGLQSLIRTINISALTTYPYNSMGKVADLASIKASIDETYFTNGTLLSGAMYKILSYQTGDDFTNLGGDNTVGSVFTPSEDCSFQPSSRTTDCVVRTADGTYLTTTSNLIAGIASTVVAGSFIISESDIGEGVLVDGTLYVTGLNHVGDLTIAKDSTFVLYDDVTPTVWTHSSIVERVDTCDEFYKFITSSSQITYSVGTSVVDKTVKNRLFKARNIDTQLNHSRGTVISSPVSHMEGGQLIVYDNIDSNEVPINERFTIVSVILRYYKKPNTVSFARSVDCDLEEIDHIEVVRKAVELASAADAAKNYQTLTANNAGNKTF